MSKNSFDSIKRKRAVFLDRDGVLVEPIIRENRPYSPRKMSEFKLTQDAAKAVEQLFAKGFSLFIATNQPDLARGKLDQQTLQEMHDALLIGLGGPDRILGIYICPHDDQDECECRKPKPGLLIKAQRDWGVDLKNSYMIGDTYKDVEAAKAVDCRSVILNTVYNQGIQADHRVSHLLEACEWILSQQS